MATKTRGRLRISSQPVNNSLETFHPKRKKSYNRIPSSMKDNFYLDHPDLRKGQKRYLWSICSIYSTAQMKQSLQDQFINQLFYEMGKGIFRDADWHKYLKYISDPSKRKRQFENISPKLLRAPKDQYKFRYYRDHVLEMPTPPLPGFVREEIQDWTRVPKPKPKPIRYVSRKRRSEGHPLEFPKGHENQDLKSPKSFPPPGSFQQRSMTSLGFHPSPSNSTYSDTFILGSSSSNGESLGDNFPVESNLREGRVRPRSRMGRIPGL